VINDIETKRRTFNQIDVDGDGFITADELRASLETDRQVSADNIATIIQMADDDGDRQIDFAEYAKLSR
jgi:calmodulin